MQMYTSDSITADILLLEQKRDKIRKELESLQKSQSQAYEQYRQSIEPLKQEEAGLRKRVAVLKEEANQLQQSTEKLRNALTSYQSGEYIQTKQKAEEIIAKAERRDAESAQLQIELSTLSRTLSAKEAEFERKVAEYRTQYAQLNDIDALLKQQRKQLDHDQESFVTLLNAHKDELMEVTQKLDEKQKTNNDLTQQYEKMTQELEKMRNEAKIFELSRKKMLLDIEGKREAIAEREKLLDTKEKQINAQRQILAQAMRDVQKQKEQLNG